MSTPSCTMAAGRSREKREQVSDYPSARQGRKVLQNIHTWHSEVYCHLGLTGFVLPIPTSPVLTWFSCFEVAQLPSYSQQAARVVHSVPRTGHCFSLLQKSKLLFKKERVRNREEKPLKCKQVFVEPCCLLQGNKCLNTWLFPVHQKSKLKKPFPEVV